MIANPRPGRRVRLHYRRSVAPHAPHHGRAGVVVAAGKGRPRNHLVRLDGGLLVVVPCGNLNPAGEAP